MGTIKINNIVYGSNNASDIVYRSTTVEEKLDTIPIFDINDNGNVDNSGNDVLTYGHIIDNLNSSAVDKTLSANQGKVLKELIDDVDNEVNTLNSTLSNDINTVSDRVESTHSEIENLRNDLINIIYPIGSIYMSVNNISPASFLGGTWEAIAQGKTLWGASESISGGTEIPAGLPNITGEIHANTSYSGSAYSGDFSGAFTSISMKGTQYYLNGRATGNGWNDIGFDASKSNAIYGKSTTVQPPAVAVYIWKRIS